LASRTMPGEPPLEIRVGLHYGPTLIESSDVYGDAVNLAARIVALAKAGQIITSRQTIEVLSGELRTRTRQIDRAPVKGKQTEIDIYEVIWRENDLTRMEGYRILSAAPQARLSLRWCDKEIELDHKRPMITMGRGQENEIIVPDEYASRLHARIEYRRGKFVLFDQSTNGTFVSTGEKKLHLHREEFLLQGAGEISLGRSLEEAQDLIHFVYQPPPDAQASDSPNKAR